MAPSATSPPSSPPTKQADPIRELQDVLKDESALLALRFRALFALKHHGSHNPAGTLADSAIAAMAAAFESPSALLKHEVAYCLGQTGQRAAMPHLRNLLLKQDEDSMCRHEAAEGLGALGFEESLELLRRFRDDDEEMPVVRETCEIAVERILWENSLKRGVEKSSTRYENLSWH